MEKIIREYEIIVKNSELKDLAVESLQDAIELMEKNGWQIEGSQSITELKYKDATMYVVSQVMKRKK